MQSLKRLHPALLSRWYLPACFVLFLVLRVAILFVPLEPKSDAAWYVDRAIGLAAGRGYEEGGLPTAFWPVGYPTFLAAVFWIFGPHVIAAKLANLGLSCTCFALTLRVARKTLRNEAAARVAVLLLAIYPNNIAYTGVLFSEMLATFLLLLAAMLFLDHARPGRLIAAGLVTGFGALVKAQFLLLPFLFLAFRLWEERDWRKCLPSTFRMAIPLVLGTVLVVAPWSARNWATMGSFILISTNGGFVLLEGANPDATGRLSQETSQALTAQVGMTVADQVAADKRARAMAIHWMKENPGRVLALLPMKAWYLWMPDGEGEWWFQHGTPGYERNVIIFRAVRVLNQAYYYAALGCALLGVIALVRGGAFRQHGAALGVGIILFITGISVIFTGQSRFHFPAMPWVFMYAGYFLATRLRAVAAESRA